jgi:hypothetical protein
VAFNVKIFSTKGCGGLKLKMSTSQSNDSWFKTIPKSFQTPVLVSARKPTRKRIDILSCMRFMADAST